MNEADHYFAAQPRSTPRVRHVEFTVAARDFRLATDAGVFSGDRLDPGTAVLLRKAPLPTAGGDFLDLGCGYGPVATVLAAVSAGQVTAVDVNPRAVELTRSNAAELEMGDRVRACAPEEVPSTRRFDEIWSNPPIRIGKDALHDLLREWLPRLKPGGVAWLVVARHKGADSLAGWLVAQGYGVDKHASQKGYRVLRVASSSLSASRRCLCRPPRPARPGTWAVARPCGGVGLTQVNGDSRTASSTLVLLDSGRRKLVPASAAIPSS